MPILLFRDVNAEPHIDEHIVPFKAVSAVSPIRDEKSTTLCSVRPLIYPQSTHRAWLLRQLLSPVLTGDSFSSLPLQMLWLVPGAVWQLCKGGIL